VIDKVAWLRVEDGRVLAARSHGKTVWYLPGGKREPGETDLDTLAREVTEELAISIDPDSAVLTTTVETEADGQPQSLRMACYTANYTGTITPSAEIAEVAWLGYADRTRGSQAFQLVLEELHTRGELR
jgi:8-oxo-dGTP diphosphatase